MKKLILFFTLICALGITGCRKFLDKEPFSNLTPAKVFASANDLAIYVNSFYVDQTPSAAYLATSDNTSDYITGNTIPPIMSASTNANNAIADQALNSANSGGWKASWPILRNINYFLDNNTNSTIPLVTRNNYNGLARYFRAYFYYRMLKQYGDVPWYSHALAPNDNELYKPQDPRTLVADSIVADLNFAIANLTATKDPGSSTVTKWVALALKSRFCLFEGTYRKYHTELNLTGTASAFLNASLDASSQIISSGNYKLHNTGSPTSDYRALFTTETPWSDEVLLASVYSSSLKLYSSLNQLFISPTLGFRTSPIKQFINCYLNADGSRFTDKSGYDTLSFVSEVKNRDLRLQQTIRCNGYKRANGTSAPPDFGYTYTGYDILKYSLDDTKSDLSGLNTNSVPVFRYAEILLNAAEAKAELGQFTAADWASTIAQIRLRAGITNALYPTKADPYLTSTYFPNISDPALLEIRRERGVELFSEGLRFDDIKRWKAGQLMTMPYYGIYVPAMNTYYATNGDGVLNVDFVTTVPATTVKGVVYYLVPITSVNLTKGTSGNIHWLVNYDALRVWDDKFYYYPIPQSELVLNPKLKQNQGW
ncbi:RagB/SusD family nutrient uptake outer membrane protein [Mucilaginibacter aquaedulcis]|uniref:RagB/SusD family nutrient uptake outer membrane protein n=1 Tax=Mucilaginibacter aquaedulcis TaxID=1187081 RepID=UPI0025B3EB79|nr:RagB/SusD family nutrient uptake outer membrane protein [Mucilaginibacter aquaedulcis]MDN3547309.1 RagB/SusD family nutrient uptake outer membrane protein [Mucilaginibacter aquaedulcis]